MSIPRISLVTPSLNQGRFLEQTIRSVLEQGYPDLQYGVVDGGSTDGTLEVLRRYRDRLDYVLVERDRGQSDAINKGLSRADGRILAYLNSDDTLLPGALAAVGAHFARHPADCWLIGHCREIDASGRPGRRLGPAGQFTLAGALLRRGGFNVPQPATFWRRELTESLGGFDADLHHCMDFEMWCRFLAHGHRPALPEVELATYRLHAESKTCSQPADFERALIEIERRYLPHLPPWQRLQMRRLLGYQTRALALRTCAGRPWRQVLRRPWWLGSQQVVRALARGPAVPAAGPRDPGPAPQADAGRRPGHLATPADPPLDILFVSEQALWPLDQGFRVHGCQMLRALRDQGAQVAAASIHPCPADAPADLRALMVAWPDPGADHVRQFDAALRGPGAAARRRLLHYLVDRPERLAGVLDLVDRLDPAAVVGLGLHSPPMLRAVRRARGLPAAWYGADELLYFHLSCLRRDGIRAVPRRLRQLAVHGLLENLFVRGLDGAIGVSPLDAWLLRRVAGARGAVLIRNGVDLAHFAPPPAGCGPPRPDSIVFWGRLDFEPNIDAVRWFADHVWPRLRRSRPQATWRIVGPHAVAAVRALADRPGVLVVGAVPDVRPEAWSAAVTILQLRCGGGIKNKLLEAAAMGRPIVASPRAVRGLALDRATPPLRICRRPAQWADAIERLWSRPEEAALLAGRARAWVAAEHHWPGAARTLLGWLGSLSPAAASARRALLPAALGTPDRAARRAA